jgi:hypothetical protein
MFNLSSPRRISTLVLTLAIGSTCACHRTATDETERTSDLGSRPASSAAATDSQREHRPLPTLAFASSLGSCEPSSEITQMLARISETADANGNGEIEKTEAYSAVDFLVGGFFFRADKNFDGSVSVDEGRDARRDLLKRSPMLASLMKRIATTESSAALDRMADLLGIEYDKTISSNEMRDAGRQLIDEVYRLADQDKNGRLSAGEAQQATLRGVRSVAQSAFAISDSDGNKKLSLEEFKSALDAPARVAFKAADLDNDGALTSDEAASALSALTRQVWLPAPSQSATNSR